MRFLVTAGNTRQKIDEVRDWGNIFTGNTGYAIAKALAEVGEVDLVTSNRQHLEEVHWETGSKIRGIAFHTHEELKQALARLMGAEAYDAVFMTAAVADYRPIRVFSIVSRENAGDGQEKWVVRDVQAGKVKSTYPLIAILGEPTEKLVDMFRRDWGYRGILVKFKLEVGISKEQLLKIGEASRTSSGADYLVANTLEMIDGPNAGAYLLWAGGDGWVPRGDLPGRMVRIVKERKVD